MLDLEPILARLAAATPGPWVVGDDPSQVVAPCPCCGLIATCEPYGIPTGDRVHDSQHHFNSDFIANAPTDIAALVAEVERLRNCLWQIEVTHSTCVGRQDAIQARAAEDEAALESCNRARRAAEEEVDLWRLFGYQAIALGGQVLAGDARYILDRFATPAQPEAKAEGGAK